MVDAFGRWFPDFPGQLPYQDPAYYRTGAMRQQSGQMQQAVPPVQQPGTQQYTHNTPAPVQGGFVRVQSEQEARAYPVAPGSSITFIDESRPYCYTKSVDMSQLDRPKFERYRLVKEEEAPDSRHERPQDAQQTTQAPEGENYPAYALKSELDALRGRLEALERKSTNTKAEKKEALDNGEPAD